MDLQWTNKCEIKRNLYKAEGRVIVDVLDTIYTKAKQLNQNDIEENEQDHGDEEVKGGPDFKLIKPMLNMVWQPNTSPDIISVGAESIFPISKVNPKANNYISNDIQVNFKIPTERRQRNAAIISIVEAIQREDSLVNESEKSPTPMTETHVKLLKPQDFLTYKTADTLEEIHSIVNTANVNITSAIFKKNIDETVKTVFRRCDSYKPSVMAGLYYKKYLERSKLKEMMHHTVKLKTEKLIKLSNMKEAEIVCLPQHRHLLTEDCIVCQVICKKYVD